MTVYKYAFLTEIDNNQYEVFHIERLLDDESNIERINRIEEALSSGENISGIAANGKPGVLLNSTWDGTNFTLPNPIPERAINAGFENGILYKTNNDVDISAYVFLRNNKVFFMFAPLKDSLIDIKMQAAFENNVTVRKIDNDALVTLGYIWDGNNFNPPA